MCVSTDRAEFSGTTVYAGRVRRPGHGLIHVLGYQNTAVNLAAGPNAMLLHLPALPTVGPGNFVSTAGVPDLLTRMVDAVRPRSVGPDDGIAWMGWDGAERVRVFEHDVYTVLLAADPTAIPAALARVPERRRPRLDPALLEFYAVHYPLHTVAVCCFDNADARRAKPLLLWYEPLEPDLLVAPALDCHTGGPPSLDARVPVDHWVLFGSDEAPAGWGCPVAYPPRLRHSLRACLPDAVIGAAHTGALPNGDFALTHADLLAGDPDRVRRLAPGEG
ncbi:hypothetical protein GCM10027168_06760 [Streptomyces capparidis]